MNNKGQAFTSDLIIGVVIFFLVFGAVIIFFYKSASNEALPDLVEDGKNAANALTLKDGEMSILNDARGVNYAKLVNNISMMDYQSLKNKLGVRSDVCFFLVDMNDNVIPLISDNPRIDKISIGDNSGTVNVSGYACGKDLI